MGLFFRVAYSGGGAKTGGGTGIGLGFAGWGISSG
jgi:hypothetical protein